jgi:NNP family nitrate/nitrite transporter-like MFS transporter
MRANEHLTRRMLQKTGQLEEKSAWKTQYLACINYRTWCMMATYGFCFGVELTMNNIVAGYFHDQVKTLNPKS